MGERTAIHLVRHGEVHNPGKVLYGRLPGFRLSDAGVQMAGAATRALVGRDVTLLVSSPLERARQTAEPLAAAFGLDVVVDDRLIESANLFEGRVVEGVRSFMSFDVLRHLGNPHRPSWGEPYAEIAERVRGAVDDARKTAAGHEAVLVSHQLPIWVFRRAVEGRPLWHRPDRRQCALASITTVHYDDDQLVRVEYSEPAGAGVSGPPGA